MNKAEAIEMADLLRAIGGFTKITVMHHGFVRGHEHGVEVDGQWYVELVSVNAAAGNRNCTNVNVYAPANVAAIARNAKGVATKKDKAAMDRIAADREQELADA